MSALTNILSFFQSLDRSLVSLGYNVEIDSAVSTGNAMILHLHVTGSIYNDTDEYASAELIIKDAESKAKAWVRDVAVDFYPCTQDELVREINAELPDKIGGLPTRPLDVARVLASQFKKLGLEPANSINSVL